MSTLMRFCMATRAALRRFAVERFDLVFCDPPTFSNSKRMEGVFDVQRDAMQALVQRRVDAVIGNSVVLQQLLQERFAGRLRLAGVLADQKKYDEALKQLDGTGSKEFEALVADRRGDILLAQGKAEEAKAAYRKAWDTMDPKVEYRRLIDAKLTSLGAAPPAEEPKTAGAAK